MFLSKLMPLDDALNIINKFKIENQTEKINVENSFNRVLAENIKANSDSPLFNRSAMDGYAIKAEDTFGFSQSNPAHLKIVDEISAGEKSDIKLKNGEAIKIATGAPIPQGSDGVVMEEYTYIKDGNLDILTSITPRENISPAAEDFKKGDLLLKFPKHLRPPDIGLLAAAGNDKVNVFKKPVIGIITTGNELVMPGTDIKDAEIVNSNYFTFKALVESTLAVPVVTHCIDDAQLLKEKIREFLKSVDALITTGGTAISKGDVAVEVVNEMGEVLIHGVSLRPGKPFGFGIINEKPVFMLSGYPVAAMVQFDAFVRGKLLKMQNIYNKPQIIKKVASRKITSSLGRTDYIRAKTDDDFVYPLKIKGSGVIKSMVESNSYIIIEENVEGIAKGEECNVLLYDQLRV
jgi:molybdopterin molybdotransferase